MRPDAALAQIEDLLARRRPLLPASEGPRLAALRQLKVLDTGPEAAFDELVRAASLVCGMPIALVSLIDAERQWFKARCGLDATETPREAAFGAHAIHSPEIMEIADATTDARKERSLPVAGWLGAGSSVSSRGDVPERAVALPRRRPGFARLRAL